VLTRCFANYSFAPLTWSFLGVDLRPEQYTLPIHFAMTTEPTRADSGLAHPRRQK
jgi:hypothetical protein